MILFTHDRSTWPTIASHAYNLNEACLENADVRKTYGGPTFGGLYGGNEIINPPIGENATCTILAMKINDGDQNGTSTVNERGCFLRMS